MMNSKKTIKVQTAFRFDPILIGRLKEAARMADISVNEYVTIVLTDATKDIESEMEKEERRKKTEDFLAKLRDDLKALEDKKEFVFIEPVFDKNAGAEQFTAAMKHCARRIKDCVSVIGFAIPSEILASKAFYIEELSAKHAQYCFFCKEDAGSDIVRY